MIVCGTVRYHKFVEWSEAIQNATSDKLTKRRKKKQNQKCKTRNKNPIITT